MIPEELVLAAAAGFGLSGAPVLLLARRPHFAQATSLAVFCISAMAGLAGAAMAFAGRTSAGLSLPWPIPGASFRVEVDALSALFMLPVLVVGVAASVHGIGYWNQAEKGAPGTRLRVFFGLACGGAVLLLCARNSILFLFGWETMAIAAFFLVGAEDHLESTRRSAWVYLLTAHAGVLALLGLFALLARWWGTLDWVSTGALPTGAWAPVLVFVLGVLGFGLKAGLMPLHLWLPGAHADSPSHVSALMSGVLIKMGIYGLARLLAFFPHPPLWWGAVLMVLGAVSAVAGIVCAAGQRDLKRMLAYSSVENIGIVVLGLGFAALGMARSQPAWIVLGMGGALLHVLNHSLFKGTLFLCAGSVVHAAGTRDMDRLGGLGHAMPRTALFFVVAACAACALPPLNGFVGELLLYRGLFDAAIGGGATPSFLAIVAIAALAATGALAAACFVRAFGAIFLGAPRSHQASHAHESSRSLVLAMSATALGCALVGLFPMLALPVLDPVVSIWVPAKEGTVAAMLPFRWLTAMGLGLCALLALGVFALRWRRGADRTPDSVRGVETWGCGYTEPSPRMQYTATSFGQILVSIFAWLVRPRGSKATVEEHLPKPASFSEEAPESVLEWLAGPVFGRGAERLSRLRWLQQGSVHVYLAYILIAVVLAIAWAGWINRGAP